MRRCLSCLHGQAVVTKSRGIHCKLVSARLCKHSTCCDEPMTHAGHGQEQWFHWHVQHLPAGTVALVGRAVEDPNSQQEHLNLHRASNFISLADGSVSRCHALVFVERQEGTIQLACSVQDLGSKAKVSTGGRRCADCTQLVVCRPLGSAKSCMIVQPAHGSMS